LGIDCERGRRQNDGGPEIARFPRHRRKLQSRHRSRVITTKW
jgi:hypothetical protein